MPHIRVPTFDFARRQSGDTIPRLVSRTGARPAILAKAWRAPIMLADYTSMTGIGQNRRGPDWGRSLLADARIVRRPRCSRVASCSGL
jgi:hypothetical protein